MKRRDNELVYKRVLGMYDTLLWTSENQMGDLSEEDVEKFLAITDAMNEFLANVEVMT